MSPSAHLGLDFPLSINGVGSNPRIRSRPILDASSKMVSSGSSSSATSAAAAAASSTSALGDAGSNDAFDFTAERTNHASVPSSGAASTSIGFDGVTCASSAAREASNAAGSAEPSTATGSEGSANLRATRAMARCVLTRTTPARRVHSARTSANRRRMATARGASDLANADANAANRATAATNAAGTPTASGREGEDEERARGPTDGEAADVSGADGEAADGEAASGSGAGSGVSGSGDASAASGSGAGSGASGSGDASAASGSGAGSGASGSGDGSGAPSAGESTAVTAAAAMTAATNRAASGSAAAISSPSGTGGSSARGVPTWGASSGTAGAAEVASETTFRTARAVSLALASMRASSRARRSIADAKPALGSRAASSALRLTPKRLDSDMPGLRGDAMGACASSNASLVGDDDDDIDPDARGRRECAKGRRGEKRRATDAQADGERRGAPPCVRLCAPRAERRRVPDAYRTRPMTTRAPTVRWIGRETARPPPAFCHTSSDKWRLKGRGNVSLARG